MATLNNSTFLERVAYLNEVGIALSVEKDFSLLLEKILQSAKVLTHADGGSIYTVLDDKRLRLDIMWNDSLHVYLGGGAQEKVPHVELPLFLDDGSMNEKMVVTYAVNHKKVANIKDAYTEQGFDFSGTKVFDEKRGYRTKAVLVVPIKNYEGDVLAVLQLINPLDVVTREIHAFTKEDVELVESLASQAGVALSNRQLIENLHLLFESFIEVIAHAIDKRSSSTANHGARVPIITDLLARAVNETTEGALASLHFSEEELYELKVAALLHDCGKITTPMHLVEKKSKLEGIWDRILLIEARYEWLKLHAKQELAEEAYAKQVVEYEEQLALIKRLNRAEERVTDDVRKRVYHIAQQKWRGDDSLLSEEEVKILLIEKGNLTAEERQVIENHVVMTIEMLEQLLYPKNLARVPEIAGAHHERIDGKGYPRKLKGNQMSYQARILAIADVFEALSAPDRSYKRAMKLSTILKILEEMVEEGHLDKELFTVFRNKKVYLSYAREYLSDAQIDLL